MKKLLLFCTALLLVIQVGCGHKEPNGPLRICVDLTGVNSGNVGEIQGAFQRLVDNAEKEGGPQEVTVEVIPSKGSERESVIDRIRTEIASGGGPDVFVVNSGTETPLFRFPHTIMKQNYMLPLDKYIAQAKYMEWEQLNQAVMEIGKYKDEQLLLPFGYTFPITLYRKSDVSHEPSRELSWQDVLADETGVLAGAANDVQGAFGFTHNLFASHVFGQLADFDEEKLLFSEDELKQKILELMELNDRDYSHLPSHLRLNMGVLQGNMKQRDIPGYPEIFNETDPLTMIPMYQENGGITAMVDTYACVNRNTKDPEGAFFLLDYLLSQEIQQYSDVYNYIINYIALPTHNGLLSPETPVLRWNWSEENYQEYCKVRDQITCVRFHGMQENHIAKLYRECMQAYSAQDEEKINKLVHEAYRVMSIELEES